MRNPRDVTITIGIPTLNGPDRLDRCLTSIARATAWNRFGDVKVIVHDDASSAESLALNKDVIQRHEFLRDRAGLEMIMSETRGGISHGWNLLTRHRTSEIVVLFNDDIEVERDYLDVLVWNLLHNPHAGMVGLSAYTGLTRRQVEDLRLGHLYNVGVFDPETAVAVADRIRASYDHVAFPRNDYRESRLLDGGGALLASCGYAFAFRREDFDAVDGFDEQFFVYYEEVDFGVSMRKKLNRTHYMVDYPTIWHMGGATMSAEGMNASERLVESRVKFEAKWGKTMNELHEELAHESPPVRNWNSHYANWVK